jgi:hypothetical protein
MHLRTHGLHIAAAVAILNVAAFGTASAQAGTIVLSGVTPENGVAVAYSYTGPSLSSSSVIRSGFGNTTVVNPTGALWWQSAQYSGQSMAYGNSSFEGTVLEFLFDGGIGNSLTLTGATFGGYLNQARRIGYRFFSDDFANSSALFVATPGNTTPDVETFTASFGRRIRLQLTEVNTDNNPTGRGAYDVGIQNINYRFAGTTVVPEPSTYALLATGLAVLVAVRQRRRSRA